MIDPDEIRRMVQYKRAPENSRVFYGSAFWMFRNVWAKTAGPALVPIAISIISAISLMHDVPPDSIEFWLAHFLIYFDLAAILLACIIKPLIIALMATKSAIVFLPDRCIHFDNIRSSNPNKRQELWYASISNIQLKLSFWLGPHLVVRDYAGRQWKWYTDACYGPRGKTFQDILMAYNTYTVMNRMPYLTLPYLPAPIQYT